MADYRKRVDPPAQYKNMLGDRSKKPLSVQMAEVGVEFTPAGTVFGLVDIKEELQKENPDYYKVGMMAGLEAIGLIPGLDKVAVDAIKAGARKAGLDKVADQTDNLLNKPKAEDAVVNQMAGFTGQNPPTYEKRKIPIEDQETLNLRLDVETGKPYDAGEILANVPRHVKHMFFREPIAEFARTVTIPKKGLLGSEFLKMVKKNESIADSSLQPQIIDPKKRYTRDELLEALGAFDEFSESNLFQSIGNLDYPTRFSQYQRQKDHAGFLGVGEEWGYFEIPINARRESGEASPTKPFKAKSQHFGDDTIAHTRGSIVRPDLNAIVSDEYSNLIGNEPFLLVEEIQSDLLQKGYLKPGNLNDAAFQKSAEGWTTDNYVSFQEAFGDISKDIQSIFEELDNANIVRPDFLDAFNARGNLLLKSSERGYVLSNELSDVLNKIDLKPEDIESQVEYITSGELPIIDVDTGAELSLSLFSDRFKKQDYLSTKDKTQRFFDKSRKLLANRQIDKEIEFADFQNLYERYKTNQYRLKQEGFGEGFGLPPITKNKQAVEESLKVIIAKAAQQGVDKIVIPPAERIARARYRTLDPDKKGDRFYRTYVTDLNKALADLEKNYPVTVSRDVELPYEDMGALVPQGPTTQAFYDAANDFVQNNLIEVDGIRVQPGTDLELLNTAADNDIEAIPLTDEQEDALRMFAAQNNVFVNEAADYFHTWLEGQMAHLETLPEFAKIKEDLKNTVSKKGTVLDISELVKQYTVEKPRQFAEGGSVRPKLRPGSDRRISPKPRLRPDPERQYGLADVEFRADMDSLLSKDPIARLGFDVSRLRYSVPEGFDNAFYAEDYSTDGGLYTERGITFEPDTVNYGPDFGSSKETIAHETRHRGLALLREMLEEDPEYFSERYGNEAAVLLNKDLVNEELLTELFDNPDATYVAPATGEEKSLEPTVQYVNPDTLRRIRERGSLGPNVPNAYIFNKGIVGLRFAAEDMLKEAGEPTGYVDMSTGSKTRSSKKYKPSFFQKLRKKLGFAEGGAVGNMNQQMELFARGGLKDDGMNVDPVSGNEVPSGSLAEEVRDDIPAQLSEGEYVVPADVVRYYGVKFFEDLRDQAKMGLTRMEADGRIGGEPVEDDLSPQEMALLQEVMAAEQPIGMNEGGLAPNKNEDYILSPTLPNPALSVPGMSYMTPTTPQPFVQQPTTPTPSVEYCESINMMYDPEAKMCVPKPTVQPQSTDNDDSPTVTPTGEPGKSNAEYLNENLNFSDPDSIMEWAQGLSEPMKGEKLIKGAGLLMGGPGAILAGGVTAGDALKNISDLRAAAIIARARGDDDLAKNLDDLVEKRIKASSGIVDILDDLVATGQQKAEGYAKYLGFESLEDMSKPENQERLKARTRKYTVKDLKQDQAERERVQAMSRQQAEAAGIDTGGGDDDNNTWEQFKPAATGTATVVDSDGSSRTVTTYNVDKVKEEAKKGVPGGRARGGLMQKRKRTKNPKNNKATQQ